MAPPAAPASNVGITVNIPNATPGTSVTTTTTGAPLNVAHTEVGR